MQSSDPKDSGFKRVTFDGEDSSGGILSRDGQTLCAYSYGLNPITRVYRVREEAGGDPIEFVKFELNGRPRAVSGKSNRVIVKKREHFEIHEIGKDASKLVCQIDVSFKKSICALNEDGSEAAFVMGNELRIVEVNKVSGSAMDQPAIVTVKVPESARPICQLVYDDGGKLRLPHGGGKLLLYDPSTKVLILFEAPQEAQSVTNSVISPKADCLAFLISVGKGENGKYIYRMLVKGRLRSADLERLFGYKVDKKNKLQP